MATTLETDIAIVGTGSVGSMAAWHLAKRGVDVLAIDRFTIPSAMAAYTGESRLYRKLYAEGAHYLPLLNRAQRLWRELESESGTDLLSLNGAVTFTDDGHPMLDGLIRAGRAAEVAYELLDPDQARDRFPGHTVRDTDRIFFDPEGGFVRSERGVAAALASATANGARLLPQHAGVRIRPDGDGYAIDTDRETVHATKVIVASGTGSASIGRALGSEIALLPQVLTWFPIRATPEAYAAGTPVFLRRTGDAQFYGFPSSDGWTVKVAASVYLDEVASTAEPLSWDPRHLDTVCSWVEEYLPGLVPSPVRATLCTDGYTDDHTGLLGELPGLPGVVVATGFSGHGFKMAPALGAVAAELALDGESEIDVSFMSPSRSLEPGATLSEVSLS